MKLTEQQLRSLVRKQLLTELAPIAGAVLVSALATLASIVLSANESKFLQKTADVTTPGLLKMKIFLDDVNRNLDSLPNAQKISSDGTVTSLTGPQGMSALKSLVEEVEAAYPDNPMFKPRHMKTLAMLCKDYPPNKEFPGGSYCERLTEEVSSTLKCIAADISQEVHQTLEFWQYDHTPVAGDLYQLGKGVEKGDYVGASVAASELVLIAAAANPAAIMVGGFLEFFGVLGEIQYRRDCLDKTSKILEQLEKLEAYEEGQDVDFDEIDSGQYRYNAYQRSKGGDFYRIKGGRPLPKTFREDIPIDVLFPDIDDEDKNPEHPMPIGTVLKRKEAYSYGYEIIGYTPAGDPEFELSRRDSSGKMSRRPGKMTPKMKEEALELFQLGIELHMQFNNLIREGLNTQKAAKEKPDFEKYDVTWIKDADGNEDAMGICLSREEAENIAMAINAGGAAFTPDRAPIPGTANIEKCKPSDAALVSEGKMILTRHKLKKLIRSSLLE